MAGKRDKVCLGMIAGAHGVRGELRVQSYTREPRDMTRYGALSDETGKRRFALALLRVARGQLIMRAADIADRDTAQALAGTRLYVERAALPEPAEDEYYQSDLIGLAVASENGAAFGKICALHDFGAGDLVEIERPDGERIMLPFTRAVFPRVDVAGGRAVVEPPGEVDAEDQTGEKLAEEELR